MDGHIDHGDRIFTTTESTFSDRYSGRRKCKRRSLIIATVADGQFRSMKFRSLKFWSLKALSLMLSRWRHRSLNDVIRSQIVFLRPICLVVVVFYWRQKKVSATIKPVSDTQKPIADASNSIFIFFILLFTLLHDI